MNKKNIKILKRDGREVAFDKNKITNAIYKAFIQTTYSDLEAAKKEAVRITPIAVDLFYQRINGNTPNVEEMQDVVEQVLMAAGHYKTAKHYILYREEHKKLRDVSSSLGFEDDIGLTINQLKVLESRYLRHNEDGKVLETPQQLFRRVAKGIAENEIYDKKQWEDKFYQIMINFEFMPAGGYLRTVGIDNKKPMLANCFVLPIEDDMKSIFNAIKWMALIHQKGGGTGFNFSKLRPRGDYVKTSGGYSSGPISFMKVFDAATRQVMQGGFKRGANMGIMNINHPDILEFISCKLEENEINNFNISVGITDKFMQAVESDSDFDLINPRDNKVVQSVKARSLFNQIVTLAWRTGDPGVIFLDEINRHNPLLDTLGRINATNPCGEQPLHPFDVCNLGSLNLAKFVKRNSNQNINNPVSMIDWKRLEQVTRLAVRFLDNGVDVSSYPIKKVMRTAKANRRIGLGVMGWADMLFKLRVSYASNDGVDLADRVMGFIQTITIDESEKLAEEKGVFDNYVGSSFEKKGIKQRNMAITTIAPTGTISMISETSSGIEPVFALSFVKNVIDDQGLLYINPNFKKAIKDAFPVESDQKNIFDKVARDGSCQHIDLIPDDIKKVFVTAHDIAWDEHVKMQSAFQRHTDNAVSKTINFPNTATISEVEQAYILAWKSGCKGVTIYRDGSKGVQILETNINLNDQKKQDTSVVIQSKIKTQSLKERFGDEFNSKKKQNVVENINSDIYSAENNNIETRSQLNIQKLHIQPCPECGTALQMSEGCMTCYSCGWSKCSV